MNMINRPLLNMVSVAALLIALEGCDSLSLKKSDQSKTPAQSGVEAPVNQQLPETPTVPEEQKFTSVWEHIRSGYGLPDASNSAVDAQIRFYTSNKNYFYKITQQSEPYLYYVVGEMHANKMPLELALLPFIESSYNPTATSASNMGMWQFGATTARNFGLKQNHWYDGRKDVVASTDAAIRLLKKLYVRFDNDWLLAVAAYNAGDGTIQQAIDKNRRAGKPIDFWSLPLNRTTQGYIPQLIALSKIVANPNVYDFKLYPIADVPYFVKVNVDSQINLADAAQKSFIDATLLKKLNTGFNGWLTDPSEPRDVLVPVDSAATFRLQLDSLPKIANTKWQEHLVKKGDTLDSIAKKYGASAEKIKTINNLKSNNLSLGQRLQIPFSSSPSTEIASEPAAINTADTGITKDTTNKDTARNNIYIVKSGDNLWSIAKAKNLTVDALAQLNGLNSKSGLQLGQKLVVASKAVNEETKEQKKSSYTIKSGDTLGKIAAQYDVSVKQIMQWNKIKDETSIRPDQELVVLADPKN
jgi:membrane-bound lytic murein transglycosylase D